MQNFNDGVPKSSFLYSFMNDYLVKIGDSWKLALLNENYALSTNDAIDASSQYQVFVYVVNVPVTGKLRFKYIFYPGTTGTAGFYVGGPFAQNIPNVDTPFPFYAALSPSSSWTDYSADIVPTSNSAGPSMLVFSYYPGGSTDGYVIIDDIEILDETPRDSNHLVNVLRKWLGY